MTEHISSNTTVALIKCERMQCLLGVWLVEQPLLYVKRMDLSLDDIKLTKYTQERACVYYVTVVSLVVD